MAARERGRRAVSATAIPAGLDHFTVYVGLIGSALELGKLVATQKRDLKVIDSHYEIEASKIDTAMREVEAAMSADFRRDRSLRKRTFESINMLIAAGQHEIALKFYERLLDGFTRGALEGLIALRNHVAVESGTRLRLK
ncbi:MAG: hypothetical protein WDN01_16855 [Rhizomicrobium sp.]